MRTLKKSDLPKRAGNPTLKNAALQQHAEQRILEEATLHLLKRFSILLKRYSEWYQNAVTAIRARAALVFRHPKRMSALGQERTSFLCAV